MAQSASGIDEEQLYNQIEALLDDPQHRDNPLRDVLEQLYTLSRQQHGRLERLVRISDGYHQVSRQRSESLSEQYDRQLRRLEKLARISDRYQNSLRELSESLREASLHDSLTGIGNRRFLMDQLKQESERARRKQTPFSVAILDADHFKRVNDTHGHDVGDRLLCAIARTLQANLREYDRCGRWGGEEFLVLFPQTDLEEARRITERLREAIADTELAEVEPHPSVSVSIGLTGYRLGEGYSETINRADEALLQAKRAGRNRVQTVE